MLAGPRLTSAVLSLLRGLWGDSYAEAGFQIGVLPITDRDETAGGDFKA